MDIRQYVTKLQLNGELLEIEHEIDARLEISATTDFVCKSQGPGLLFKRVKGLNFELATNLFGSDQRIAQVLGFMNLRAFGSHFSSVLHTSHGDSSAERIKNILKNVLSKSQDSQRKNNSVDFERLGEMRFWPKEERGFLTLAVVISREPDGLVHNYGLYRVGIVDNQTLTINLLPGSGGSRHLELWRRQDKEMPVAIVLGADPALILAAAAPLPHDCTEEAFSTYFNQTEFRYSRCQAIPLDCPTSGQIVIEGWMSAAETLNEGPFGCYTGDYGGSNDCPLVKIVAVTRVDDPLIPLTVAGPLPMEDCWIAKANLEIIRARLKIDLPEVCSIAMPLETAFHGIYFLRSFENSPDIETLSKKIKFLDYLSNVKLLILLTDQDDDVTDENWRELLGKISTKQIWQDPSYNIEKLNKHQPANLQHDRQMQLHLLRRLQLDEHHISEQKAKRCRKK